IRLYRGVGQFDGAHIAAATAPDVEPGSSASVCEYSDPDVIQKGVGGVPELPLRRSQIRRLHMNQRDDVTIRATIRRAGVQIPPTVRSDTKCSTPPGLHSGWN